MKTYLIIFLLISPLFITAQCLEGNCTNGIGTYKYKSGNLYKGDFQNGKRHGKGLFTYAKGGKYKGQWNNGKRHGTGIFYYPTGNRFEGTFAYGEKINGTFYYTNGNKFVGNYKDDKKNGQGTMYLANGTVLSGNWKNDAYIKENTNTTTIVNKPQNTYAVIVGVADYQYGTQENGDLNYTDDDARRFYNFLKTPQGGNVPSNNIKLLLDAAATKTNILQSLQHIFSKATSNDCVIFYFSGHGADGYFLPYDNNGYMNRLDHEEVKAIYKNCPARTKLCFADACLSGSIRAKGEEQTKQFNPQAITIEKAFKTFKAPELNIVVMMSSRPSELSIEFSRLEQGVFSYFLLEGLEGKANTNQDKYVNIEELFIYVQNKVRTYTANRQNPVLFGKFSRDMVVGYLR